MAWLEGFLFGWLDFWFIVTLQEIGGINDYTRMTTCLVSLKNDFCFYNCTSSVLSTMSKLFCSHDYDLRMKTWQS